MQGQKSRRESDIKIKEERTREAAEEMEEMIMHIERERPRGAPRLALAIDPSEAKCAARALAQSDVTQFGLVMGCKQVVDIVRKARLPLSTPVVSTVADPSFARLIYGTDDKEAHARRHCTVARKLREHLVREYGELFRNVVWTVGGLLAVREVQRERGRRHSDTMSKSRRCQER